MAVFQEGQLGNDEYVNVIMKYVLKISANYLWQYKKYRQAYKRHVLIMNHLGLIAEWKDGCAMTTKSKTMPECLVPCPLRTSYRGTLPSLMCSLHWKVREYKSSVGENKVK